MEYSKNARAGELMGLRPGGQAVLEPAELGFHCPVCQYPLFADGGFDKRLTWSEYNAFLWCAACNRDYPSCLCVANVETAIEMFLDSVEDAVERGRAREKEAPHTSEA